MAKGRKLTTSRSDRYLGSYSSYGNSYATEAAAEFGEDDVWSVVDNDVPNVSRGHDSHNEWSPTESSRRVAIPRGDQVGHAGGLSLAFDDQGRHASPIVMRQFRENDRRGSGMSINMASSAPVEVPDWSKIYRVDSVESMHDSDDDQDAEMVPPHVYLARSRRMEAASVFEGQGRTLKGRDMSRVRDTVWSRTGFDG